MAASGGGHLDLLLSIEPALGGLPDAWITVEGDRARGLRESGKSVHALAPLDRNHLTLRNPLQALRLALKLRPALVITSGAGVVLPFVAFARALGARVLFAETMARVSSPSMSGRFLSRLASKTFVQWPELLDAYPHAVVCRPTLLEPLGLGRNGDGQGTFVAVGTHPEPFDRLLEMVDSAAGAGVLPEPIVAQTGPSGYEAQNFEKQPWITRDRFGVGVTEARYVIGHAGSGLVGAALRAGRKPLVLARGGQDEHVDDHQTQLAAKLEQLDLAVRLGDEISRRDLASADAGLPDADPFGDAAELGHAVREEVDRCMQTTRQGDANGRSRDHAQQRR
ncbi:MAG: hypothetical protein ACJ77M_09960 [Thermoleophilaceae bacterium]